MSVETKKNERIAQSVFETCQQEKTLQQSYIAAQAVAEPDVLVRLYDAIIQCYIDADACRGIHSGIMTDDESGEHCLMRDATELQALSPESETQVNHLNYTSMGLNYTIALITLLRAYDKEHDIEEILKLVELFRNPTADMLQHGSQQYFLAYVQHVLAPILVEANLVKNTAAAVKVLDKSKDWAALELPTLHVATLDNFFDARGNATHVVRLDSPFSDVTTAAIDEFNDYADKEWFQKLKPYEKALFEKHYRDKLLQGHVIPSQLRSRLPGLKNAFHSQTFIQKQDMPAYKVANFFHCGGLPYVEGSDHELIRTAVMAGNQQREISQQHQSSTARLHEHIMISLNSRLGDGLLGFINALKSFFTGRWTQRLGFRKYVGYDAKITNFTENAAKQVANMHCSNLCLNSFRRLEGNRANGIRKIMKHAKQVDQLLRSSIQEQRDAMLVQPADSIALPALQAKRDQLIAMHQQLRDTHTRLKKRLSRWRLRRDKNVNGTYIVSLVSSMTHQFDEIREALELSKQADVPAVSVWFGCASGENRTGIAKFVTETEAVAAQLQNLRKQDIQAGLAKSQHVQVVVGFQGGSAGMTGIRQKSMDSLPDNYSWSKLYQEKTGVASVLVSECADMKSSSAVIASTQKKIDKAQKQGQRSPVQMLQNDLVQRRFGDDWVDRTLKKVLSKPQRVCVETQTDVSETPLAPSIDMQAQAMLAAQVEQPQHFLDRKGVMGLTNAQLVLLGIGTVVTGGMLLKAMVGYGLVAKVVTEAAVCTGWMGGGSRLFRQSNKLQQTEASPAPAATPSQSRQTP